ncbi:pentatricopeptide repeat-containing protein At2g22410, mitochondrial-like [Oryza brachyantha]|uniref:Pentatricopeptide repeat-containing protein n=1 Tax=Oryza brachyantha TaxID=4533 RepID=J3MZZ6_ORYBR|nr:pentatricopeptide repeat-containing protein At2g22410, mitochondrial-like [Oryza brachyantha]XP_040383318.1 pentatricopeptide repeat-containing protein At2g22410, mitochondrial-like [Oryza brachyantha]XP_040383319.1 pentatricopeptide repeat-containing protein At2g22410, mitochondrial-like [Oryza brachyantha]XP_040383320.1 pentatricopeptide repeat-containing protein At2g22410, mitochondrial-like [Oryza brachyantha]
MLAPSAGGASRHVRELLRRCGSVQGLNQLHAHLVVHGSFPVDAVVASYCALPGGLCYARSLFDRMPDPDRFTYNHLIRAYCSSDGDRPREALRLHRGMIGRGVLPNEFTLPFVLKACARTQAWEHVVATHGVVVKLGFLRQVFVGNALLHSYASAGLLWDSRQFFDEMADRNVVSWNSMINGYAQAGKAREACSLFAGMRRQGLLADEFTLVSLLLACSVEENLAFGRLVHCHLLVSGCPVDLILSNALVDMYGKCGDLSMAGTCFDMMPLKNSVSWTSMLCALAKHGSVYAARDWFEQMPEKSVVSWNAMISCYVQGGRCREALDLYNRMKLLGLTPDEYTLAAVLSACGQHGDLASGKMIHDYIRDSFNNPGVALFNSLLDMYARCGQVDTAISLFSDMPSKNVISWNTIIGALAMHGRAQDALMFFRSMVSDAFSPDEITFVALLSACNHGGLLEAGQYYFQAMSHVYNVRPGVEHYACMVDLLGRGGQLAKAVELIKDMPTRPDVVVWGALLGACRIHGHIQIGRQVIKQLLELEGMSGGLFVLISNLLYETHQWEDMTRLRKLMRDWGTKKNMGISSIDTNDNIHEFGVEDSRHESLNEVYAAFDQLPHHLV